MSASQQLSAHISAILQNTTTNPYVELKQAISLLVIAIERPGYIYQLYFLWPLAAIELVITLAALIYYIVKHRKDSIWLFHWIPSNRGHFLVPRFPVAWLVVAIFPLAIVQPYFRESIGNGPSKMGFLRRGSVAYAPALYMMIWVACWFTVWTISISSALITIATSSTLTGWRSFIMHPTVTNIHFISILVIYVTLSATFIARCGIQYNQGLDIWQEIIDTLTALIPTWTPEAPAGQAIITFQTQVRPKLVELTQVLPKALPKMRAAWAVHFAFTVYVTILSIGSLVYQIYILKKHNIVQNNRRKTLWKNIAALCCIVLLIISFIWLSAYCSLTAELGTKRGIENGILVGSWSFTTLGMVATVLFTINTINQHRHPKGSSDHPSGSQNSRQAGSNSKKQEPTALEINVVRVEMVGLEQTGDSKLEEDGERIRETTWA